MLLEDLASPKKKSLNHPKADELIREYFLLEFAVYEAQKIPIIYLNESGFKSHDYRLYGYASKGDKCFKNYNWQLTNLTNTIGVIHNNQLFAVGLFNSSINSDIFYTWVEQLLIPDLPDNSVIVMDHDTFHKRTDIQGLIEEQGHTILWLPAYNSDLNPIETARAKLLPCSRAKQCFAVSSLRA